MNDAANRPNLLAYGDNLDVLKRHVPSESVDLVYLDPPFNSNADYNVLFEEHGERAAAQIKAFADTWGWDTAAAQAYQEVVEAGGEVATTLRAFRTMLGTSDMLAYLSMMAPRLVELRRVLRPTGSLFLHCDPTASHYLKLLLDAVFGASNFKNEIVWSYKRYTGQANRFQRLHDVILFYGRSNATFFSPLREAYGPRSGKADSHYKQEAGGRWFRWQKRAGQEPYKIYLSEGRRLGDVWELPIINASARERLGYPTQKPLALLERIIAAASKPGDVVLDPFCGCGTTVDAATGLGRQWIGIDITHLATGLVKHRLVSRYGPAIADSVRVVGEPTTEDDAAALAADDPYQFQAWALGLVGARTSLETKRGGDKGIDGRLFFHDEASGGPTKQIVISVKAGHLVPAFVRDLRGVIDREEAQIGVLISFEEPSPGMRAEAASAGFYDSPRGRYPRIQLRTIRELLDGHGMSYPPAPTTTFRPTLWEPEEVPTVPRRPAARRPAAPPRRKPEPVPISPIATMAREAYADLERSSPESAPVSPEGPQSPRTTKHDRIAPLPSPESGGTD